MRPVVWSQTALDDFDGAIAYLAERSPKAARRIAEAIDQAARGLGEMPTGRQGRLAGTYEKPVRRTPYVIAYALADAESALVIPRVIHMARDWPEGAWPEA